MQLFFMMHRNVNNLIIEDKIKQRKRSLLFMEAKKVLEKRKKINLEVKFIYQFYR